MSISNLISIAWDGRKPNPKAAQVDVLVLTGHKYFVDLRVKKSTEEIEWAFAGTRTSQPGEHKGETKCTWSHLISSRVPAEAHIPGQPVATDSGINSPHPDDPLNLTLERGRMLNPENGAIEPFEEVWKDVEAPKGTLVAFLEREDGKAMIGTIGQRRIGVGIGWGWKTGDEGGVIQFYGKGDREQDGSDIEFNDLEAWKEGERVQGCWIIQELWRT
ncbi:hypothetical protein FRB95_010494 [Tulasnella sp. JGI-2019a]|nr:hypothetical protein FRB95_010494 [Tulasnella sp. JGI-2019a]